MPSTFSPYIRISRLIAANLYITLRSSSLKYGQEGANHRELGTHRGAAGIVFREGSTTHRRRCLLPGGRAGNVLALLPRRNPAGPQKRQGVTHPPGDPGALPGAK